jgi:hypothetical protein
MANAFDLAIAVTVAQSHTHVHTHTHTHTLSLSLSLSLSHTHTHTHTHTRCAQLCVEKRQPPHAGKHSRDCSICHTGIRPEYLKLVVAFLFRLFCRPICTNRYSYLYLFYPAFSHMTSAAAGWLGVVVAISFWGCWASFLKSKRVQEVEISSMTLQVC